MLHLVALCIVRCGLSSCLAIGCFVFFCCSLSSCALIFRCIDLCCVWLLCVLFAVVCRLALRLVALCVGRCGLLSCADLCVALIRAAFGCFV